MACYEQQHNYTQSSELILTPSLRLIVLLHHQWDHIQLLLMGVVGLQDKNKLLCLQ
jgi:hypothetical protein